MEIDVTKCRFYNNGCDSHILCTGDDDIYGECYYKQLQQLKAENEELHRRQNVFNILKKIDKYKQCLDEIEEYCKGKNLKNDSKYFVATGYILKLIKEAKEGE